MIDIKKYVNRLNSFFPIIKVTFILKHNCTFFIFQVTNLLYLFLLSRYNPLLNHYLMLIEFFDNNHLFFAMTLTLFLKLFHLLLKVILDKILNLFSILQQNLFLSHQQLIYHTCKFPTYSNSSNYFY